MSASFAITHVRDARMPIHAHLVILPCIVCEMSPQAGVNVLINIMMMEPISYVLDACLIVRHAVMEYHV